MSQLYRSRKIIKACDEVRIHYSRSRGLQPRHTSPLPDGYELSGRSSRCVRVVNKGLHAFTHRIGFFNFARGERHQYREYGKDGYQVFHRFLLIVVMDSVPARPIRKTGGSVQCSLRNTCSDLLMYRILKLSGSYSTRVNWNSTLVISLQQVAVWVET